MIETILTPFQSLDGSALNGLASLLLTASLGRAMAATGIRAGLMHPAHHPKA